MARLRGRNDPEESQEFGPVEYGSHVYGLG